MSHWSYSRIGLSVEESALSLAKQVMECLDIPISDEIYWAEMESSRELLDIDEPDLMSEKHMDTEAREILYHIALRLFGKVSVFFAEEDACTVDDSYHRYECALQSHKDMVYHASCNYCDGDNLVGEEGDCIFRLLREEIEAAANKKKIPIVWASDCDLEDDFGYLCPASDNNKFYNLAMQIYYKRHDELATDKWECELPREEITEEYINTVKELLAGAKKRNYQELTLLISNKFTDIL